MEQNKENVTKQKQQKLCKKRANNIRNKVTTAKKFVNNIKETKIKINIY